MNEDATKNNIKMVSLKFSSISRISLTQTFSFILFLASKRVRVNISAVSCSYNEWFRRRAEDLLFLATFESVMKKDDVGTVFCIMHLGPAPNGIVRLSPVAELCTNHLVISRHLQRHSGGDLDQRLWPLLSFLMAAVFHPLKASGHCVWQILREE